MNFSRNSLQTGPLYRQRWKDERVEHLESIIALLENFFTWRKRGCAMRVHVF
jgi:hypothetical protein